MKKITAKIHNDYVFGSSDFWASALECGEHPGTMSVSVPDSLVDATTSGCGHTKIGIYLVGCHRGRRWGIVKYYSIWAPANGEVEGAYYIAYDLTDDKERSMFETIQNAA